MDISSSNESSAVDLENLEPTPTGWREYKRKPQAVFTSTPSRYNPLSKRLLTQGVSKTRSKQKRQKIDKTSIYFQVFNRSTDLKTIIENWVKEYEEDHDVALLNLIQFIINSAGCKGEVPSEFASETDILNVVEEDIDYDMGKYPIIHTSKKWTDFRNNLCDFMKLLVNHVKLSILYDQYLINSILSFLIVMSQSDIRAFRHTATFLAMKLGTALVDVDIALSANYNNLLRQIEAESNKPTGHKATDRLEFLMSRKVEFEENQEAIKNWLLQVFQAVFVQRFSDVSSEIKVLCIEEICLWIQKNPTSFLSDKYLKYISWSFYDRTREVRLNSLLKLKPIIANPAYKDKLELFLSKFKERLLEMTLDKEYEVAIEATNILTEILKNNEEILSVADQEPLFELVYSHHRGVAVAAGNFLSNILFANRDEEQSTHLEFFLNLAQFFRESEQPKLGPHLIDSLFDSNQMLKDWKCMTDVIFQSCDDAKTLDDELETIVIKLMGCCIHYASTHETPPGREPVKRITSQIERQISEDKIEITRHFIRALPVLLRMYNADPQKLAVLWNIPMHFNLDLYNESCLEKYLDDLLMKLIKTFDKVNNYEIWETCCQILEKFGSPESPVRSKSLVAKNTLIDIVLQKYQISFREWSKVKSKGEETNEDFVFNFVNSVFKISVLCQFFDFTDRNIWDLFYRLIEDYIKQNEPLPEKVVAYCIKICFFTIICDFHNLCQSTGPDTINEKVNNLHERLMPFMKLLKHIIQHKVDKSVKMEAYLVICDLLLIFPLRMVQEKPFAVDLVCTVDENLQKQLIHFVHKNIFTNLTEEQLDGNTEAEELNKRKTCLASFCKLVSYNVLAVSNSAEIFRYYLKFDEEYGDLIKETINNVHMINSRSCGNAMVASLIIGFTDFQRNKTESGAEEFTMLKALAKKFASHVGLEMQKFRPAVTAIHRQGIIFSAHGLDNNDILTAPHNLQFLEIISELSSKLIEQDRRTLLTYLEECFPGGGFQNRGETWDSLIIYQKSLKEHARDLQENKTTGGDSEYESSERILEEEPSSSSRRTRKQQQLEIIVTPAPKPNLKKNVSFTQQSSVFSLTHISEEQSTESDQVNDTIHHQQINHSSNSENSSNKLNSGEMEPNFPNISKLSINSIIEKDQKKGNENEDGTFTMDKENFPIGGDVSSHTSKSIVQEEIPIGASGMKKRRLSGTVISALPQKKNSTNCDMDWQEESSVQKKMVTFERRENKKLEKPEIDQYHSDSSLDDIECCSIICGTSHVAESPKFLGSPAWQDRHSSASNSS